jgi:NAD(P)-dependent dehydrogenase (short-subunit alcohol dehydrogenase family)
LSVFDAKSTTTDVIAGHDLTGRNVVVTGGAAGLGYETARALASAGARVLLAGRNADQGQAAVISLREVTGNDSIIFSRLDLASLTSVREFAATYNSALHLLINNAGVMAVPLSYTADGFETQLGVNHLGHFALTTGLLPALRAAGTARVIALSSRAHRRSDVHFDDPNYRHRPYDPWESYGQSKSANALFAAGLTQRYKGQGITGYSVMPGGKQGAATTVYAAVTAELAGGEYLDNCAVAEPWTGAGDPPNGYYLPRILDLARAERLWSLSADLTCA